MMRALPFIAVLTAILFAAVPAAAQLVGDDTAPGSSCAGFPAGASRLTADADQDGASVVLICDGTTWNAMAGGGGGGNGGTDQTGGGTAISGGNHGDGPNPESAFDDNNSTRWASSQSNTAVSGAAYIGYDFGAGVTKDIRQVSLRQGWPGSEAYYSVTGIKVQYSDNGSSWSDASVFLVLPDNGSVSQESPVFASVGSHRYWRLLANSNTGGGYWSVYEVEMRNYVPSGGSADNLGNHTATQDLDLATNDIINGGAITGTAVNATGATAAANGLYLPAANTPALSANSVDVLRLNTVASGVNYFTMTPSTGTDTVTLGSNGTGATVPITVDAKGSSTITLSDPVTASSTLGVMGAATLSSTLGVTGNATFDTTTLFVDAASNEVGVGTAAPDSPLHVVGDLRIDNDTNTTNKGCLRYDGTGNKLQYSHDCTTFSDMGSGGSGASTLMGTLHMDGAAGCEWGMNGTTFTSLTTANASCAAASVTGGASAPAEGKIPAIKFASLPAGDYEVTFNVQFLPSSSGAFCRYRIYDGSTAAGKLVLNTFPDSANNYMTGIFSYGSTQTNKTFYIQARRVTGGGTDDCSVFNDEAAVSTMDIWVKSLTGVASGPAGDHLGNHTATQDLEIGGNDINNAATVAVGIATASDPLHVVGQFRIDNDTNTTNKGCIRFDGTGNKLQFSHDCTTFADMGGGGAVAALDDIGDVDASSVLSGQVLGWSGSTWVPFNVQIAPSMISASDGTNIGDMTDAGGLAAAFDGNTAQNDSQVAYKNANGGWVGKQYSSANEVTAWKAWGSSDYGFSNASTNGSSVMALQYKDASCSVDSGWTTADSVTITNNTQTIDRTFASLGAHTCWRIKHLSGAGNTRAAELQLFKPGSATAQELWAASGGNVYRTSGNVGVGVASPDSPLHVIGDVRVDNDTNTTNKGCLRFDGTGNKLQYSHDCTTFADMGAGSGDNLGNHTATANIQLGSNWLSGDGGNEGVYVDSTGKIGVGPGNNAPTTYLDVTAPLDDPANGFAFNMNLYDTASAAQNVGGGIAFEGEADTGRTFAVIQGGHESSTASNYSGYLRFLTRVNGQPTMSERMRITSAGNVGIGTTSPSVALDVAGDIEYTGTIADVSDIRLKTDIAPLQGSLMKVTNLEGISFRMKDDAQARTEFGFSAQDLQKVYPELVQTADDEMGTMTVNYIGLIAPMAEAIKELKAENDKLRAEFEAYKAAHP